MTSLKFIQDLVDILTADNGKLVKAKSNPFLRADFQYLQSVYFNEKIPAPGIAYIPVASADDLRTKPVNTTIVPGMFDRTQTGDEAWQQQSKIVFEAFSKTGKATKNGRMIHPVTIDVTSQNINFAVQECGYFDQVATHLGMDFKENAGQLSLRDIHQQKYPGSLPPLDEMPNSFGVSMVLFYKDADEYVPCIYKRTENVAVFSGTPNSTASGAVDWPEHGIVHMLDTLQERQLTELYEETGLRSDQVSHIECVGLTRELARDGKLQGFFAAVTDLNRDQLVSTFAENSRTVRKSGGQELADQLKAGEVDILPPRAQLMEYIKETGMGPEGAANLYFSLPYLKNLQSLTEQKYFSI